MQANQQIHSLSDGADNVRDLQLNTYIENNCHLIPNYGERWRYGEAISTGFVESTINEVVAKYFR